MAGTRLNCAILTAPSSVSTVNKEFICDIGVAAVLDTPNYALAFNVTDSDGAGHSQQFFNGRISGRGLPDSPDGSWGLFASRTLADRYNTERMGCSCGPQAILFGMGDPGGIVDSVSQPARLRDSNALGLGADDWGAVRAAMDINRTVIDKKIALAREPRGREARQLA